MGKITKFLKFTKKASPIVAEAAKIAATNKKSISNKDQHLELLRSIDEKLAKQTSKKENFKLGVIRGLGTAIGATVVAAIALALASSVIDSVDDVPIIKDIIDSTNLDEAIEDTN